MAKGEIQVEFRNATNSSGETAHYQPGNLLEGIAIIIPKKAIKARHIYIELEWQTHGRGDVDRATVEQKDVFQGELMAGMPVHYDFSFVLPPEPWSYNGHYVNIMWTIKVQVDVPFSGDIVHREPFVLSPEGRM